MNNVISNSENLSLTRLLEAYFDIMSMNLSIFVGCSMLCMNLLVVRVHLLLCGARICMQSESVVQDMCNVYAGGDRDISMNMIMLYGAKYSVHKSLLFLFE